MERRFHQPVIVATLLVIPVMVLQGLDPGQPWSTIGFVGDCAIWLVFLAEVVAMLWVSADRWRWVRSNPLDVMIVVLTPPVAPAVLQSVRILRLLRLIRLFRVARLVRGVFTIEGVRYAAFLAFVTFLVGAQAFASTEHDSIGQGLYWAMGTMTTAGSGDVMATTSETKAVASVPMIVGLALGAIITGAIAQRFIVTENTVTQGNIETLAKQDATHAKLDAIAAASSGLRQHSANACSGPTWQPLTGLDTCLGLGPGLPTPEWALLAGAVGFEADLSRVSRADSPWVPARAVTRGTGHRGPRRVGVATSRCRGPKARRWRRAVTRRGVLRCAARGDLGARATPCRSCSPESRRVGALHAPVVSCQRIREGAHRDLGATDRLPRRRFGAGAVAVSESLGFAFAACLRSSTLVRSASSCAGARYRYSRTTFGEVLDRWDVAFLNVPVVVVSAEVAKAPDLVRELADGRRARRQSPIPRAGRTGHPWSCPYHGRPPPASGRYPRHRSRDRSYEPSVPRRSACVRSLGGPSSAATYVSAE